MLWWAVSAADLKTSVEGFERASWIENTDMYTNIYTVDMLNGLKSICGDADYAKGEQFIAAGKQILQRRYATSSDAEILLHSEKLYETLQKIQFKKVPQFEWSKYCRVKVFVYGLMQYLRESHIEVMKHTWIINDFDGYEGTAINWFDTKIATLQKHNRDYAKYTNLLWAWFTYTYDDKGFMNGLDVQDRSLLSEIEQLMKHMLSYSIHELINDGILDQTDVEQLRNKMNIEYGTACNLFHGRYEIKQTLDSKGNHISYETQKFTIKVNLCPSYFVIRDMPSIFQRIITHELAHHIYYYKDDLREDFKDICWSDETTRNNQCSESDFVTAYAQTAAVEDYAEHFMHWYLDLIEWNSYFIKEKSGHFDDMF